MACMPSQALIKQAAASVLTDSKLINFPGRALFQYLESHLFDPNLTVASWCWQRTEGERKSGDARSPRQEMPFERREGDKSRQRWSSGLKSSFG